MLNAKQSPLIIALVAVVVVMGGYILLQEGNKDCQNRHGPILQSRFNPFKGCEINVGGKWRTEEEMKESVEEGVAQIKEGSKKVMEGILGK
jgi:hypothetical protein